MMMPSIFREDLFDNFMEDMRNQTLKEGMINQMSPRENISFQGMMKPMES